MSTLSRSIFRPILALFAFAALALAQTGAWAQSSRDFTPPELEQMLAPIALYPDPLLSQILMAATYPSEVREAARWSRSNPGLDGDDAVRAVQGSDWDPSVRSLVAFPNVLERMDAKLDWTRDLGDAFLDQEEEVMDTIQRLRRRADVAGNLVPDQRQRVYEDRGTIVIEPVDTRFVYVPYYDPWIAYGSWAWAAYPPVAWAPWSGWVRPRAVRPGVTVAFSWGPAIRVSTGFFFGAPDWHQRHVRVAPVQNYYYRPRVIYRDAPVYGRTTNWRDEPHRWQHDSARRHSEFVQPGSSVRVPAPPRVGVLPVPQVRVERRAMPRDERNDARAVRKDDRDDARAVRKDEKDDAKAARKDDKDDAKAARKDGKEVRRGQDTNARPVETPGQRREAREEAGRERRGENFP